MTPFASLRSSAKGDLEMELGSTIQRSVMIGPYLRSSPAPLDPKVSIMIQKSRAQIRIDPRGSRMTKTVILAHQLKAARALARLDQQELSDRSGVSVPTIKRMEAGDGPIRGNYENVAVVVGALEAAGVEFIEENGGGPGVRLKKTPKKRP
jgi:hypothetical protein